MFSYFVPISLLVLAGFTLGLWVGWLTWVSSKKPADQEPVEVERPDDSPEPVRPEPDRLSNWSVIRDQAPDWSPTDLPYWRMREVSGWPHPDVGVPPSEIDA